jgi:hypothetical protein
MDPDTIVVVSGLPRSGTSMMMQSDYQMKCIHIAVGVSC